MLYDKSIKKAMSKLDEASNILGGIALLGNLSLSDSDFISSLQMDVTSVMSDLENFMNGTHNSEE